MGKKVTLPNPKAKSKEKKRTRTILNFFIKGMPFGLFLNLGPLISNPKQ
jgi:hypothetical protein